MRHREGLHRAASLESATWAARPSEPLYKLGSIGDRQLGPAAAQHPNRRQLTVSGSACPKLRYELRTRRTRRSHRALLAAGEQRPQTLESPAQARCPFRPRSRRRLKGYNHEQPRSHREPARQDAYRVIPRGPPPARLAVSTGLVPSGQRPSRRCHQVQRCLLVASSRAAVPGHRRPAPVRTAYVSHARFSQAPAARW